MSSETVSKQNVEPRLAVLARRLAALLVQVRSSAGEDLQATMARAIDQAFAGIAREYRR
ncbi:MAG TPA: hypothetical protein VFN45_11615 [Myxococcaceae bacterium]|nr:hypothetical protein [Myxococcaceae bacterium]